MICGWQIRKNRPSFLVLLLFKLPLAIALPAMAFFHYMGLIEQAKKDTLSITSDLAGFSVPMILTTPDGLVTANILGLHTKHHMSVDENGQQINSKNAHASFSELQPGLAGYPVRNANGEVSLYHHKLQAFDSNNNLITYVIQQTFPDETVGLIVVILGDFV